VIRHLELDHNEIAHRLECLDVVIFNWIENAEKDSPNQRKLIAISQTLNKLIKELKEDANDNDSERPR
jgi:hypothetical protein